MQLNRRKAILIGASAATGALGYAVFATGLHGNASIIPGITPAHAQAVDLTDLAVAPDMGEKFLGQADAPVTIIEYASATCPHCARFHEDTFKKLKAEYIDTGKVKFIFREFPFDDLALAAFMLARCAPEDKYFPMIDVLFEQQAVWSRNNPKGELFKIAKLAGFTEESFEACLRNEEIFKGIVAIREKAGTTFGVDSTPTFFINGAKLQGNQDFESFKKMIEAAG